MSMDTEKKLPEQVAEAQLEEYRLMFEAGYSDALMHALMFCARWGVLMPEWVDRELHRSWNRFISRSADDLGEAFGIQWPKGKHKAAYIKKRRLEFAVYGRIRELHLKPQWRVHNGEWHQVRNMPIDEHLFDEVGKEFHIGKRLASEYYYSVKERMSNPPIAVKSLLEPHIMNPDDVD
ncbi:MAG: hypothetical protein J5I81_06350 [Nitrococcus mobilis]|nr:hypothetical protein [Nitrococcus mobilis]